MPIDPFTAALLAAGGKMLAQKFTCRGCGGLAYMELDFCCGATICRTCLTCHTTSEGAYNRFECPFCSRAIRVRRSGS